jgi:hypothetical protein
MLRPHYWLGVLLSGKDLLTSELASAVEFSLTGYGSLVAGKVLSGDADGGTELLKCPCYISDWGIGAAYTGTEISLKQESRLGAQLQIKINEDWSAYIQAVARAYDEVVKLDWASSPKRATKYYLLRDVFLIPRDLVQLSTPF